LFLDPDPKLCGKWDPDPKKIVTDPQHYGFITIFSYISGSIIIIIMATTRAFTKLRFVITLILTFPSNNVQVVIADYPLEG
jgi:hypothetical protein